ncbi:MAG: hypothetical protein AB1489_32555, partial [Acidobacteriota bacterium]
GAGATNDPFIFTAPKDWRSERIAFPLDFAPEIKYQGFEELRFAPGMFNVKSDSYFTYTFFWWLEGKPEITSVELEKDLVSYFKGLCNAVGRSRGLNLDLSKVHATVQAATTKSQTQQYNAVVETYDPFNSGNLLSLNLEISARHCNKSNHTCIFFLVSPKSTESDLWRQLREIRDSFQCDK